MNKQKIVIRIIKLVIVLVISVFLFFVLLFYLTHGLKNIKPIEIKNECQKNKDEKGSCEREFRVSIYFEDVKNKFEEINKDQTILQKLAGVAPDIFKYSISFEDESIIKMWKGQNSEIWKNPPLGDCPFSDDFEKTKSGGKYKEKFGLMDVPLKLKELATSLNDCKQYAFVFPENVDSIERTEKYNLFVEIGFWSYIF